MKHIRLCSLFVGLFAIAPLGVGVAERVAEPKASTEINVERVSVQYGNKRPFSFYYPYSYKYYYPQPNFPANSRSCYWVYTNGTYVYVCS